LTRCIEAFFVAALLIPALSHAADEWITDDKGCKVQHRNRGPLQASTWSGACRDGFAEGRGLFQLHMGGVMTMSHDGEAKAGRFTGPGVRVLQMDTRYEGNFVDARLEGPGQITYADGTEVKGSFVANRLDGACTLAWANGDRYEGACKAGRPDGAGQVKYANGDAYEGAVSQGLASGPGRYAWANGNVYDGRFVIGQPAGAGDYRFADGSRYTGNFRFGVPWGQGRLELPGGLNYEGLFGLGAPGDSGRFARADGTPAPPDSPELRAQFRLRYGKASLLTQSWRPPSIESMCPKRASIEVPKVKWTGQPAFRALVIVREGRVSTVEVQTVRPAADEAVTQQLAASVEKALRAYQCTGDRVFEQDFAFGSEE